MNKGSKLLDKEFITEFLRKRILPMYPDFIDIKSVKLCPYKDYVWKGEAYHIVVEYRTRFVTKEGKIKTLPIFCSAHWEEPRKNVYNALKFLWNNGFDRGYLTIPHPLMYSDYYQGIFYRGVEGKHLYHYIQENVFAAVEDIVPKAANWFRKLHELPTQGVRNFNEVNSRIETVYPGIPHILERVGDRYPQYLKIYKNIYTKLVEREKSFFDAFESRWLVHGDAHPENVIKMGRKKIAVIDFTDICLADFTRDLGSFLQQLEFMVNRKIKKAGYAKKIKKLFLDSYFAGSKEKLTAEVKDRINIYYYWTMMRTATHFLVKHMPEPERGYPLIERTIKGLGIKNK